MGKNQYKEKVKDINILVYLKINRELHQLCKSNDYLGIIHKIFNPIIFFSSVFK